ncbi:hypothetical protein [Prosthecobacter sp.]
MSKNVSWRRVMRLVWLVPVVLASLLALGLGTLFLRNDILSFRPHLPDLTKMVDLQRAATPQVPDFFVRCLERDPWSDMDSFTARQLLHRYGYGRTNSMRWHLRALLWSASLKWHFGKADRTLLLCAFLEDGHGKAGVHHLAQGLLGKPLEQLNRGELARLAVASGSPHYWSSRPKELQQRGDELLKRLEAR